MPPKSQASRQPSTLPPSASPPTALIWAHQLRRENNALLERIHTLERSVKSAVDGVESERTKMKQEREKRGREVEGRWAEFGNGMAQMGKRLEDLDRWREGFEVGGRDREEVIRGLRREIGELKEGMGTPRKSKRACRRTLTGSDEDRRTTPLVIGTQQRFESIELGDSSTRECSTAKPGEVPVSEEQDVVVRDSMATETPSDMTPEIPETQPDSQPLVETQVRPQRGASEHTYSSMDLDAANSQPSQLHQQSREISSMQLVQGSLSLLEYLQLGEEMRAKFPGRRQEGRVVEAFWEGMNVSDARRRLEETLEKEGWIWEVVREVCGHDGEVEGGANRLENKEKGDEGFGGAGQEGNPTLGFDESKEEKRKEHEKCVAVDKRKRERRSILVVPVYEDEYLP